MSLVNQLDPSHDSSLGILGGSFNPVHNGHIHIAEKVISLFKLNKILFVPAHMSPFKNQVQDLAPVEHRLKMLESALKFRDNLGVDTFEIKKGGTSYTINTLRYFFKQTKNLYFIMGMDSFLDIGKWYKYEELFKLSHFIVIPRPDYLKKDLSNVLPKQFFNENFSKIHDGEWQHKGGYKVFYSAIEPLRVSASEIRRKIKNGEDIRNLVPKEVYEYLARNNVYKA